MKFYELLQDEEVLWAPGGSPDDLVTSLTLDSGKAGEGSLYFCVVGSKHDGHSFASQAYRQGCRHFVAERMPSLPGAASVLICRNTREKMAELAARYYGDPARELTVIGITGTKGKSTTAVMIRDLLEYSGTPTGYIGSLGVQFDGRTYKTENTTPGSLELHWYLSQMVSSGCRVAVIEVSSQALVQGRVHGIPFYMAVFTNLTRDHIGTGEHRTMRDYKEAKLSLFRTPSPEILVLNGGDAFTGRILKHQDAKEVLLFGKGRKSVCRAEHIKPVVFQNCFCTDFTMRRDGRSHELRLSFAGVHYVEDFLAAITVACRLIGKPTEFFLPYAEKLRIPGRCEVFRLSSGAFFIIDYAHNGASLKAALLGLRPYTAGKLFCVFGAVGERVACRRGDMARAASRYADFSVITEDNPGNEDPKKIMEEIYASFPDKNRVICIEDREEAIKYLIERATTGDVVLLAGKGDEQFQLKKYGKIPFSEADILRRNAPPNRL